MGQMQMVIRESRSFLILGATGFTCSGTRRAETLKNTAVLEKWILVRRCPAITNPDALFESRTATGRVAPVLSTHKRWRSASTGSAFTWTIGMRPATGHRSPRLHLIGISIANAGEVRPTGSAGSDRVTVDLFKPEKFPCQTAQRVWHSTSTKSWRFHFTKRLFK